MIKTSPGGVISCPTLHTPCQYGTCNKGNAHITVAGKSNQMNASYAAISAPLKDMNPQAECKRRRYITKTNAHSEGWIKNLCTTAITQRKRNGGERFGKGALHHPHICALPSETDGWVSGGCGSLIEMAYKNCIAACQTNFGWNVHSTSSSKHRAHMPFATAVTRFAIN